MTSRRGHPISDRVRTAEVVGNISNNPAGTEEELCSSVGSFPGDRTVLGEGTEDLRAGGDIETPGSESGVGVRHRRFGKY